MAALIVVSQGFTLSETLTTVRSLPITLKAIRLTTSGITGFTCTIEEPGCMGGRFISPNPARGAGDNRRTSFEVLESFTARRFVAAYSGSEFIPVPMAVDPY